jgi:TonB family protein
MRKIILHILYFILISVSSFGQQIITGKVVDDETKKPIKDAEVLIEGSSTTSRTNFGGYFQLTVDTSNTLIISSTDYESATMKVSAGLNKFQVSLKKHSPNDSLVFVIVEQQAQFPGGMGAMYQYLNKNITFPPDARKLGVDGKVWVEFIIEKDGSINENLIKIIQSLTPSCNREAIRLVKKFPKWIPGKQNNIPVRSKFVIPITFRVEQ